MSLSLCIYVLYVIFEIHCNITCAHQGIHFAHFYSVVSEKVSYLNTWIKITILCLPRFKRSTHNKSLSAINSESLTVQIYNYVVGFTLRRTKIEHAQLLCIYILVIRHRYEWQCTWVSIARLNLFLSLVHLCRQMGKETLPFLGQLTKMRVSIDSNPGQQHLLISLVSRRCSARSVLKLHEYHHLPNSPG